MSVISHETNDTYLMVLPFFLLLKTCAGVRNYENASSALPEGRKSGEYEKKSTSVTISSPESLNVYQAVFHNRATFLLVG